MTATVPLRTKLSYPRMRVSSTLRLLDSITDASEYWIARRSLARGEVGGVSLGYKVDRWKIADADGTVIDPEKSAIRWDDDLTFTATRWSILECSLVSTPADATALIRSLARHNHNDDTRARMEVRERMQIRQAMHDRTQEILQ